MNWEWVDVKAFIHVCRVKPANLRLEHWAVSFNGDARIQACIEQ